LIVAVAEKSSSNEGQLFLHLPSSQSQSIFTVEMSKFTVLPMLLGGALLGSILSQIFQENNALYSFTVHSLSRVLSGRGWEKPTYATIRDGDQYPKNEYEISIFSANPLVIYVQNFVSAAEASHLVALASVSPIVSE
jgi:hypothetical protein